LSKGKKGRRTNKDVEGAEKEGRGESDSRIHEMKGGGRGKEGERVCVSVVMSDDVVLTD
jgi:hypothetical protein